MKLKIFLGYDPAEHIAYDVARHSILSLTQTQARVVPMELDSLGSLLTRPIERKDGKLWCPISQAPMSTEFAISRFAVPFLQRKGWALYADCDVVCLRDIEELFVLADPKYAVMVVKHQYEPSETVKMVDKVQTAYSRKNWSSVVLWNCDHPSNQKLTTQLLNEAPGRDLHRFCWLEDEEIGELPMMWNWLLGAPGYPWPANPVGLLHYTSGGPWIKDWPGGPADDTWLAEHKDAFTL